MAAYRKRLDRVEAEQVPDEKYSVMDLAASWSSAFHVDTLGRPSILTGSGAVARPGQWLVRDDSGVHVLTNEDFRKRYEADA